MVTTTVDPSAKGNFLAFQTFVQLAAIMAAHHDGVFTSRNSNSVALSLLACAQWCKAPAQGSNQPRPTQSTPAGKTGDYIALIDTVQPNEPVRPG
ncbi:hypothetical protein ALP73_100539 [Pseudomonas coronafaciens pv. garcae]|nr:hypothetical protein ALP73_100539 [Pseudomonas coronafaciens pv. garcae]